jgi:hypothetical protein
MRPRAIQCVSVLGDAAPFERFRQFARLISAVPKSELEKKKKTKTGLAGREVGLGERKV